jgi:tetratricopeptide (TPR) repeat protein
MTVLGGLWLPFGPGARRRRAYTRALRLLHQGAWQEALALVQEQQQGGKLAPVWEGRWRNLAGECHRRAGDAALEAKQFEEGLAHYSSAAELLNLNDSEGRHATVEAMLAEVRRLVSLADPAQTEAAQVLVARVLAIQSPCPEASFWQGLCHVRQNHMEEALACLRTAHERTADRFFDPALYLGALLLSQGAASEAVRYLSEANRLAPACPFPSWQLGLALLASGGDGALAVRALQRALERLLTLSKSGLAPASVQRAWLDGLTDAQSFVHRLAARSPYNCPVLGSNLPTLGRQVRLALGQAHYRQGDYQAAIDLYKSMLGESAPTVPVLRGLGQTLARLERYEDAYKHLRAAYDQEEPKSPLTAGHLAVCAAKGRPTQPGDKAKNVSWAIGLLSQFDLRGDAEWAGLCNAIHAEARSIGLPVAVEDQFHLCDTLASVHAVDPTAAAAYAHLAASDPSRVRPEYAWLYCRAAQQHGYSGEHDLELFATTFRDESAARAFYAQRQWDFDDMEYTYLERAAARQLGRFPEALGPDYPARGERLLLERSRRQEQAGREAAAVASATVLLALAPRNLVARDRLAALSYRRGDLDQAVRLLADWHFLDPVDPVPLMRQAVIEHRRGNRESFTQTLDQALALASGQERAEAAFLGARLALASSFQGRAAGAADREQALRWLEVCLQKDPNHKDALWCLAAVRAVAGDRAGLAARAAFMEHPEVSEGRFHYLAACCHLAARDTSCVVDAAARAVNADAALLTECAYIMGWAHLHAGHLTAAAQLLEQVAAEAKSPSADFARALLGSINLSRGFYEDAIHWWEALAPDRRAAWQIDEPLRATVFLSGLLALADGQFEHAAARFREAGRFGLRERRLGALLVLALVKEAQGLLGDDCVGLCEERPAEAGPVAPLVAAARLLEQAQNAGCRDPNVAYLLGLAYKRQDKLRETRAAFRKVSPSDANVLLQMGLLSLREKRYAQAEQEFAAAWQLDQASYPICHNLLLTQLTLGEVEAAATLLPWAVELAPDGEAQRLWQLLQVLLQSCQTPNGDNRVHTALTEMNTADEQRLLDLVRSLGHLDTIARLLQALAAARPMSTAVQDAHFEAVLVKAKKLLERCDWTAAERLLLPLEREERSPAATRAAVLNLLGCCTCLAQDMDRGVKYFTAALRFAKDDARIQQNLALALEWQGQLLQAEPHWNRYFELLGPESPAPPGHADYNRGLAFEAYSRLAATYSEKERWSIALRYAQRAGDLRPDDPDTLERLFHLYNQAARPEDARQVLRRLRQARPSEPQLDLYELDLLDVRNLDGLDQMLANIDRILKRHPNDARVEVRALVMIGNILPLLERVFGQLSDQLTKVLNQVRHLPNYQIDWSALREVMRDLRNNFQRLRRLASKCLPLIRDEEQRRTVRELLDRIDRKMEQCRARGG